MLTTALPKNSLKFLVGVGAGLAVLALVTSTLILVLDSTYFPPNFAFMSSPMTWDLVALFVLAFVALFIARTHATHRRARTVGVTLVVIGVLLVPAAFILAPGPVGCLGPCGISTSPVTVNGVLTVSQVSGNGTLTLQVFDSVSDNVSVTTISVTNVGSTNATILNLNNISLTYNDNLVSPTNPLPPGQTAKGSMNVAGVRVGMTYLIELTAITQDGSKWLSTVSITAMAS